MTELQSYIMQVISTTPRTSAELADIVNQTFQVNYSARAISNALTFLRGKGIVDDGAKCAMWVASKTGKNALECVWQRDDLWEQNPRHWAVISDPDLKIPKFSDFE